MKPESLLDKKHAGGLYGGKGYEFEKSYILSQLPEWLSLIDLDFLQQELWSDLELFFKSGKRWLLQIKNHSLELTEFREIIEDFRRRQEESDVQYEKYIIVSTGESSSVRQIRNKLERWQEVQHLSEPELASTRTELVSKLKEHKCDQFADFLITNAEKIHIKSDAGWVKDEKRIQDLFVSSLNANYGISQEDAQELYFRMARHLDTERGKRIELLPFREILDEANKPAVPHPTRIHYRGEINFLIEFHTDHYVGRSQEEQDIVDLASQETPGYILLKAQPGYGKSAFISHLIKQREDNQWKENCHPNLLYFFIRSHGLQNIPEAFLQALNAQIIDVLQLSNQPVPTELIGLRAQFSNLWPQLLEITNSEQPLVLLIDGLDEMAEGQVTIADLLPSNLSSYVHVIVTSRPNPDPLEQVPPEHPLKRARVRTLSTFSEAEVENLLKEYSPEPDKAAIELAPRILSITRGEPLFARFVCQEVVESGEVALARLEDDPPDGVKEYFRQQLRQLEDLAESDTIWDILGLMVVALGGMTIDELTDVLKLIKPKVSQAIKPIKRFLLGETRFELMHSQLREFVAGEFRLVKRKEYQQRLVDWCECYGEKGWPEDTPAYPLLYYTQHLKVMGDVGKLHELVRSREWTKAKYVNTPWVDSLVQDLHLASSVSAHGDLEDWAMAMAYQLRRTMIEDLMSQPSDEVIVFMAKLGRVDQALHFAKRQRGRSFQLFHKIAEVVAEARPDRALEVLLQSIRLFDDGTLLNQYGARLVVAKRILESEKIPAEVPSSAQKAQDLVKQAERMQARVPEPERHPPTAKYLCPILVLTDRFNEAKRLAESLPLPEKSQAFRHISLILPPNHPEKLPLAKRALSVLESAERDAQTIIGEMEAIVTLLPSVGNQQREKLLQKLISAESELWSINDRLSRLNHSWVIENVAKLDLARAKDIVFNPKWPSGWYSAGPALLRHIALVDYHEALDVATNQYSNYAEYRLILVDIIRIVAVQLGNISEAEELIKKYSAKLSYWMPQAYLTLAEAYLDQGKKRKAEEIFDEQVFVIDDKGVKRGRNDLLVAMVARSSVLDLCEVEAVFDRLRNVKEGQFYSAKRLLGHLAARRDRIGFIETNKLGSEAQIGGTYEVANRDPELARALWEKWSPCWPAASREESSELDAYIIAREAQKAPAKLEELLSCFDSDGGACDMCNNMVALPNALCLLVKRDQVNPEKAKEIIERVYPVSLNWKCRRGKDSCRCYNRSEGVLGHLIGIMAKLDRNRAYQIIESLPQQPIKVSALKWALHHTEPDNILIERIIKSSQEIFDKPLDLAGSYYHLAAKLLPLEKRDCIAHVIQLAEPLVDDHAWPTPSAKLRVNRAKASMKLVNNPSRFGYVKNALGSVAGFLRDKLEFLDVLSEQAMEWSQEDRLSLLRQIWELATIKKGTDIEAFIAFAVPILESLIDTGKEELLWKVYDHVEWAYQELPQLSMGQH